MPTYQYRCQKCGARFQRTESMAEHDPDKTRCPKCKSKRVNQQLGTFFAKTSKKS